MDLDGDMLRPEPISGNDDNWIFNPNTSMVSFITTQPGDYSFNYRVTDGLAYSNQAAIRIRLAPYFSFEYPPPEPFPNQAAPVAGDDVSSWVHDRPQYISWSMNDRDPDGYSGAYPGPLQVVSFTSPAHGTVSLDDPHGTFLYQPAPGYVGADSFTYIIQDGDPSQDVLTSNTATVSIKVTNKKPLANDDIVIIPHGLTIVGGVGGNDSDPDAAVLLHPRADSPQLNGLMERGLPGQAPLSYLRYQVVRVWQLPVERLLAGGVGTLPLAPISAVSEARLPEVIRRMQERLSGRRQRWAREVWGAAFVLMGLRYSREVARRLLREVLHMKESDTYQAIIEEGLAEGLAKGRAEEARRLLLRLGQKRLGPPDEAVLAAVLALTEVERLEQLVERLNEVASWQQLLAPSRIRQGNGKKKR